MSAAILPIAGIAGIAPISSIRPIRLPRRVPAIEVGVYSITDDNAKSDNGIYDQRTIVEGLADEMQSRGHKAFRRRDEELSPKQWHTPTDQNRYGIDTVDMAFISTHGGTVGFEAQPGNKTQLGPPFWVEMSCNSPDGTDITSLVLDPKTTFPDPKKPVPNMRLGDGKLRWLVLDACRSLQVGGQNERDDALRKLFEKADPGRTWAPCYAGVQMLFGYTGLVSHHFTVEKKGEAFGRKAGRGDVLSESWLDEAFSSRYHNIPVVTAFAPSAADRDWRLKSQSLKNPGPASTKHIPPPPRAGEGAIKSLVYSAMWRSS